VSRLLIIWWLLVAGVVGMEYLLLVEELAVAVVVRVVSVQAQVLVSQRERHIR
jgi:hypothetical protein